MRIGSLLLLLAFASCTKFTNKELRTRSRDTVQAKEVAEQVDISYTDSGKLKAKLHTPVMVGIKQSAEPYVEMPRGVKGEFFDDSGRVESFLSSEYAISYTKVKKVLLRRNVEVMNVKGEKLNTEELHWDQRSGKIYTEKFVKITTADQIIMGDGMTANQTFTHWVIKKVRGSINLQHDSTTGSRSAVDRTHGNQRN
ncbi:MAG: hypothetical protein RL160_1400 [Bacteroidota bacterium]|jgi:LPS export ABC transporter protein LptC